MNNMGIISGIFWLITICLLMINSDFVSAQTRRTSRSGGVSRSLGTNPKTSTSSSSEFECPEEFGYYPHPGDCAQYYVCVFGGAVLESCTGGLMYSHELQTCDWPRNVGCEVTEVSGPTAPAREQPKRTQPLVHKIRFSSLPSQTPAPSPPSAPLVQAQIRTLPPPEPLRIAPNPVVTSRGQPRQLNPQEDIAKLYADAHETLPPVEEEESDRQQRVYRGQPSTVGQVQRDRDGILQQSSVNSIPHHGKIGSFAFGTQVQPFRVESSSQGPNTYNQPQKTNVPQNNRNYYNTTQQGYDPTQYDSYYSIYDDDVELYRDVDYSQQYSTQKPAVQQSTYRTTTQSSTQPPPPPPPAQRETYITRQQPTYDRPSQVYTQDYGDDELIAQIEEESPYNPPSRNQHRGDRNELNSITERPILVSTTQRTIPQYSSTRFVTTPVTFTTASTTTTTTASPHLAITRTNTRNRGGSHYSTQNAETPSTVTVNRGTHPPRSRPTLKPSQSIVSKATEFVDIYRFPPTRPDPVYPQPTPDKTAAKCRKDVCLLPDCFCGGRDIPGNLTATDVPQIVLMTFDDAVNDLNKEIYVDLFEKGRKNPNGCPISATFYVSHEWTDYTQVQNLYADGHEMASHSVS